MFLLVVVSMLNENEIKHVLPTALFPIEYVESPNGIFLSVTTITKLVYESSEKSRISRLKKYLTEQNCEQIRETGYFDIDCVEYCIIIVSLIALKILFIKLSLDNVLINQKATEIDLFF